MSSSLKVMKFGGTSVGAADRLRHLVEIVRTAAEETRVVVVASALSGITNELAAAWDAAGTAEFDPDGLCLALRDRHRSLASEILAPDGVAAYEGPMSALLDELRVLLCRIETEGTKPAFRDWLLSIGERISVPLVALALVEAGLESESYEATDLIRTDGTFGEAVVDLNFTYRQVRRWHRRVSVAAVPVVTGFIGATADGEITTLGRGGSDYSAALVASALKASVLERWTDVDGIYTDDPHKNPNAKRYAAIVLEEAWAWNQAGKLGMHKRALDPLVVAGVPVHVRSTVEPDHPGTLILPAGHEEFHFAVNQ
ncbi:MAG TPA: aspartate kinase [Rhodothermales bacterium]|nr:aspartate kinase [Rhodothermales bacterium]